MSQTPEARKLYGEQIGAMEAEKPARDLTRVLLRQLEVILVAARIALPAGRDILSYEIVES